MVDPSRPGSRMGKQGLPLMARQEALPLGWTRKCLRAGLSLELSISGLFPISKPIAAEYADLCVLVTAVNSQLITMNAICSKRIFILPDISNIPQRTDPPVPRPAVK